MGNNHRKKNRHLISGSVSDGGGGGNGIAGLVMFGGALLVTGFIAVATSAFNKNRTKDAVNEPNTKPKPQQQQQQSLDKDKECKTQEDREIETTQGLRALLEPSTTPTNDAEAVSVSHGATDMKSINNTCIPVILSSSFATEEKIEHVPDLNTISEVVQEIVLSGDSNQESAIEEECLTPLFNSRGSQSQAQDVELEPHEKESLKSIEPETRDDGVVSESGEEKIMVQEIVFSDDSHSESVALSHDSVVQEECLTSLFNSQGSQAQNVELEPQESLKPKETETEDGDVVSEIGEEEEEEAIRNSNEKPIFCSTQEDFNFKGEGEEIDFQNKEHEAAKTIYYSAASRSFQMTMWLMPMLLPGLLLLLLLLLLTYGTQQFFVLQ